MPSTGNSLTAPDTETDDAEAKMRRALGIDHAPPVPTVHDRPPSSAPAATRIPAAFSRRRFVRDGEVPVTIIHRDRDHDAAPSDHLASDSTLVDRLKSLETKVRAEQQAREQAERALSEAQATIHDLQTKFGHECLAKDEALAALDSAKKEYDATQKTLSAVQAELANMWKTRQAARGVPAERIATDHERPPRKRGRKPAALVGKVARKVKAKPVETEQEPIEWWIEGWREKLS
jgi:hypothetical protein